MRFLAPPISLAIIVLTGVVHGDLSGRWGASEALRRAADRLDDIPGTIGAWRASDFKLDEQSLQVGEIAGYVARRYERSDGSQFTVMLVCGRPGPIAAHTPEWCYGGAGYSAEKPPTIEEFNLDERGRAAFWRNVFRKDRGLAVPEALEVCWAWNAGAGWQAPENARLAYAPDRYLYKLYVVRDVSADGAEGRQEETRRQFMRELIPVVDAALFATTGP